MAAYQAGDVRAFELLVARHERPVWNFLRRFTRDAAATEGTAKFSTWVYAIARNLCVDQSRRAVHRQASSLDGPLRTADPDATETLHDRIAAPQSGAEQQVADQQAAARIDAAVAELPDEQREVFLMREVMEMSFAEIAAVVGASEPTVKSRMRYALCKLRESLVDFRDPTAPRPGAADRVGSG